MSCGRFIVLLTLLANVTTIFARTGYGPGEQDWGFVDVRTGAYMFYWLYYTTDNVSKYTERPLVVWLQEGSSTCYGNFEEIGPIDQHGNYRNSTWVKNVNVLFIDNPVGMGFSYGNSRSHLPSSNTEIAMDLVRFMKKFYKKYPEFVNVPLHIFGEGYGGKMASEFALELHFAIQRNKIKCNLSSVALGDPWVSPIDSVLAWAPMLLNMGIVDKDGYKKIALAANKTWEKVYNGNWTLATMYCSATQMLLRRESKGVDFFNIQNPTTGDAYMRTLLKGNNYQDFKHHSATHYDIDQDRGFYLQNLMRGRVTMALNISSPFEWGHQSGLTFTHLVDDFMKPVTHIISELLNRSGLKVVIYSGQLDLNCPIAGTDNWINRMQWSYRDQYLKARRSGVSIKHILEGYEKSAGNLTVFWINRAGLKVPVDNPAAMSYILKKITNYG